MGQQGLAAVMLTYFALYDVVAQPFDGLGVIKIKSSYGELVEVL
jgi:hypothetical protein